MSIKSSSLSKLNWRWSEITMISSSSTLILVVNVLVQICFVSVNAVSAENYLWIFNQQIIEVEYHY
jgi:hypothetical protein